MTARVNAVNIRIGGIECFHAISRLKVNFHKSKVCGVGVSEREISNCGRVLGCDAASFPFKYLGVLVGANTKLKRNWQPALWRKVICGTHNLHTKLVAALSKKTIHGIWQNIADVISIIKGIGIPLSHIFKIVIGSGRSTLFWLDNWTVRKGRLGRCVQGLERKSTMLML
ncbi:unnamed protein product [Lactuca saligna]|uniref:Reverse transcriptase zinc-binding domain-containing protein n=1 Tax=Lactuca saligna TaxID=75948 RepID=A0AA35YBP4_LACSI|nr:unnamed protein product [Lactuca saligna]